MPSDPRRVQDLFLKIVELPPADRAAAVERECGDDVELRHRIMALVEAHDEPGSFLDKPAGAVGPTMDSGPLEAGSAATGEVTPQADAMPRAGPQVIATTDYRPNAEPGAVIAGRYTLQEKIGEGGMGEVWVAKQTEPVKRKVALKLIKTGMDSKAVLARFEHERQALAMMDHPNIARVLDGGMTPTGQPFFVMDLVNGLPLSRYCDEAELKPKERLELFVLICQAVQHAHQKGIVHRDLKPANILITMIDARPVPKVIDFGVAKATAGRLTEESMSTQFGAVVGTLEYMSPEQAGYSGIDIDTRADIYSLGVILYELLTGLRPIDAKRLKKAALTEMIRIIQEEEPSKPSTRLSTDESLPSLAALRQTEPRRLMEMLRGELDWVVMKCLEKSRDRRYETASALSRDIQRYLADEPVEARPPSARYRLQKFVRRNKVQVVAASLVLIALVGGMIGTMYGMLRANRAAEAERIAKHDAEAKREEAEKHQARAEDREQQAIEAVKRFRDAVADNPELKQNPSLESLRKTLLKEPLLSDMGKLAEAEAEFREAIALQQQLANDNPTVIEFRSRLADNYLGLSHLKSAMGKRAEAEAERRQALAIYQKLTDDNPAVTEFRRYLAASHNNLGIQLNNTGKPAEAEAELRQALAIMQKLADENPSVTEFRSELAGTHHGLGQVLAATGKMAEAEAEYRMAISISQKVTDENPAITHSRLFLGNHHHNLGLLLKNTGKPAEAEAEYRKAQEIFQKLTDASPDVSVFRVNLAENHCSLGDLLSATGKPAEGIADYRKALELDAMHARAWNGLARAQSLAAVQDKLPAFLKGDFKPTTNGERLALAELGTDKKLFRASAGLYADAFAAAPKLADDLQSRHRYKAACCAAVAAAGQDEEAARLDDEERAHLRKQAVDWLRSDLTLHIKQLESAQPADRSEVCQNLRHWQQDSDLAGIRDAAALSKLPPDEQETISQFWADVADLLKKAAEH